MWTLVSCFQWECTQYSICHILHLQGLWTSKETRKRTVCAYMRGPPYSDTYTVLYCVTLCYIPFFQHSVLYHSRVVHMYIDYNSAFRILSTGWEIQCMVTHSFQYWLWMLLCMQGAISLWEGPIFPWEERLHSWRQAGVCWWERTSPHNKGGTECIPRHECLAWWFSTFNID